MALPITALYAGLLALWVLFLAFGVVRFRWAKKVTLGDGGHAEGQVVIRGHANAVETVPLFLILLALIEGLGTPGWVVHLFGLVFLVGRVMHGLHFQKPRKGITLRFWGMILTILPTLFAALGLVGHALVRL